MATKTPALCNRLRVLADHVGETGVARLLNLYMECTPPLLEELQEAIGHRDGADACRLAHRFKSAVSYLGARKLTLLCSQLEDAAREKDFARAKALFGKLEAAQERLALAWRKGELKT